MTSATSDNTNTVFKDREDAAYQLIDTLQPDLFRENDTVVIGVSEGGVFYADKVAEHIGASFDILLTEAVKAPHNDEIAIAMISETQEVVLHKALIEAFDISEDYVYAQAKRKYEDEVIGYVYKYRKGKELLDVSGKFVILVDECIETGLTMMVALKSVIERGAKNIYIATPILDKAVYRSLLGVCDGIFCPHKIEHYVSIEYYFDRFDALKFEEIEAILKKYETKHQDEGEKDE